ncbi:retinol dehydrogenase 3 isoform X2 [Pseudomyrmex gracilis]|uniref:retinol dehydrogenase 3 isoform X2 n=1 Tax=Pseudomyrmex gracilis TaxID=219809 RepID=UPI000995C108|nr:retinol dehydrogenase 3 isoform X2 [Pseudomyrmex gracilis]
MLPRLYTSLKNYFSNPQCAAASYYYFNRRRKIKAQDLIVITGCDSGLGYSLAMHCRARGATVLAGIHRDIPPSEAKKSLEHNGIITHGLDITDDKSVYEFVKKVQEILRTKNLEMHALVNNAGVMIIGEFEWQTQKHAEHQINVNLLGTMRLTREMMPILRKHNSRIIVVSSHCASESLPGISIYGATKAGLEAWATSLRTEIAKYGVKVISFVPGGFITESGIMRRQKQYFDEMRREMTSETLEYYDEYFETYNAYFSQVSQLRKSSSVTLLSDPEIYETFDGALLDIRPSTVYRSESWRYFFYRILFKMTPVSIRDRLVLSFVRVPLWKPKKQ